MKLDAVTRQDAKSARGDLYERLNRILFSCDPLGINFGDNTDEYTVEVERILPRLKDVSSVDNLRRVVHEEFVYCVNAKMAGPESKYDNVAKEIWKLFASEQDDSNETCIVLTEGAQLSHKQGREHPGKQKIGSLSH